MSNKPLKDFRYKGIKLTIWPTSNNGYSCTIVKSYKPKDSTEWKESKSFFPEELEQLQQLIADARAWMSEQKEAPLPALDMDDLPF
jgi:hypothetical protein